MSGRALSEAAMLESLGDIRLPAGATGGTLSELAVAIGLAALAALAVAGLLRVLSVRRASGPRLAEDIDAALALPEDARRVALLHLLRAHAPERYADLRPALYRPGTADLGALEREVARLA